METEVQKTGIIYARVSSWEQVGNTSLEKQKRDCLDYAKRNSIKIVEEPFIEEGESAKTANRAEFQKALAFCAKHKPNYFIVYKIDRFARNQDDHVVTKAFLNKYGTELRSVTEAIDSSTIGRLQEGILSVFAEFDNNMRAERSKGGMVEKVKKGIWVWQAPIGYKRLVKGGNLVIDEKLAHFVVMTFEEYAKGIHSFESLAVYLAERGFRTNKGKKVYAQLIEKMIHNSLYCGLINVWGMTIEADFAPLISKELFLKCQPGKRSKLSGKRELANPAFPLRRVTVCPLCSTSITGSKSKGNGGKYAYYHHQKQGCALAKFIPKGELEGEFIKLLHKISPSKKFEKVFKAIVLDVWQENYRKLDGDNARIRKEVEVLESERQKVFDLHRGGQYTEKEFLEQKGYINARITEKKLLLEEKQIEEFSMEEALNFCFQFVGESAKTWKELEDLPAYRMRFQKQVFPQKITFDGEKFGTNKMSLVYEINQQSGANSSKVVSLSYLTWNTLESEILRWNQTFRIFGTRLQTLATA